MPTKSGRETAQEKRDRLAAAKNAEQLAQGRAWDAANGNAGAAIAAEMKAEADANPGGRFKREYTANESLSFAVRAGLADLGVKYPEYVLWTSESFMLFGGGPHTYTVELTKQTDAEVAAVKARWRALIDEYMATAGLGGEPDAIDKAVQA